MLYDHSERHHNAREQVIHDIASTGTWYVSEARCTGSAYYGKQSPQDLDVIVLVRELQLGCLPSVPGSMDGFVEALADYEWEDCAADGNTSGGDADAEDYRAHWCALRRGSVNIIATTDYVWFMRQCAATELCRRIAEEADECPDKGQVVRIFRAVREGLEE